MISSQFQLFNFLSILLFSSKLLIGKEKYINRSDNFSVHMKVKKILHTSGDKGCKEQKKRLQQVKNFKEN